MFRIPALIFSRGRHDCLRCSYSLFHFLFVASLLHFAGLEQQQLEQEQYDGAAMMTADDPRGGRMQLIRRQTECERDPHASDTDSSVRGARFGVSAGDCFGLIFSQCFV